MLLSYVACTASLMVRTRLRLLTKCSNGGNNSFNCCCLQMEQLLQHCSNTTIKGDCYPTRESLLICPMHIKGHLTRRRSVHEQISSFILQSLNWTRVQQRQASRGMI